MRDAEFVNYCCGLNFEKVIKFLKEMYSVPIIPCKSNSKIGDADLDLVLIQAF